jgi:hypothetical protein
MMASAAQAQTSDEALRDMIVGQTYMMAQPRTPGTEASPAELARQRMALSVRYAVSATAAGAKSLPSSIGRTDFADQADALAAKSVKAAPARLTGAQQAALLTDTAWEMSRRSGPVGGAPSKLSVTDFETMKRNVERLNK